MSRIHKEKVNIFYIFDDITTNKGKAKSKMRIGKSKDRDHLSNETSDKRIRYFITLMLLVSLTVGAIATIRISKDLFQKNSQKSLKESAFESKTPDRKKKSTPSPLPPTNQSLEVTKSQHFRIFGEDVNLAKEVAEKGEEYYELIPPAILLPEPSSFGVEGIKIYLYKNDKDYQRKTEKPGWSKGYADYAKEAIYLYETKRLEESVLPHELVHIFFDTYLGYQNKEVQWIDEGLAMSEQIKYDSSSQGSLEEIMTKIRKGKFISLEELSSKDLSKEDDLKFINLWYIQSLSIVTYLREEFGDPKFRSFIRKLKNRSSLEESLSEAYAFEDLDELEEEWLNYLEDNYLSWEQKN